MKIIDNPNVCLYNKNSSKLKNFRGEISRISTALEVKRRIRVFRKSCKNIFQSTREELAPLYTSHSSPGCVSPIYQNKNATYSTHVSPGIPYKNARRTRGGFYLILNYLV